MEINVREATIEDLDDITRVIISASSLEPAWRYLFPRYREYPDEHFHYIRKDFRTYLENDDELWKWYVMLAETASTDGNMKTISVAVWEVSVFDLANYEEQQVALPQSIRVELDTSTQSPNSRHDENPIHVKQWKKTLDSTRRRYLEPSNRTNGPLSYLHLQHLGTQPEYQYNGAGTALTLWGMKQAKKSGVAVGLFASPMGKVLFEDLGFNSLAPVVVQVEGETERVIVTCMELPPPKPK